MSEVLTRREEVAAKRAALTDGRWRNREGVGMYQRSTSNALRDMLSELKPAQPARLTKPRARTKSRSRSRSPQKRKSIAVPIEPALAGPSRIQMDTVLGKAPDPKSPMRPAVSISPSRRASMISAPLRSVHSPIPQPKPVSIAKLQPKPNEKTPSKAKSKPKASRNEDTEPEMTVAALLEQRHAKLAEEEARKTSLGVVVDEEDPVVEEDVPMEVEPSTSTRESPPKKTLAARVKSVVEEMEDSVVIVQEDGEEEEQLPLPKPKAKSRIQTIVPEPIQPPKLKPKKRIEDPKHNPKPTAKSKGKAPRGRKKKGDDEDEESDVEVASRKVSGTKRPTPSDDEDEDEGGRVGSKDDPGPSAAKRTKTKANSPKKSKAKSKPKSKPRKPAKSASASSSRSYHSAPESPEPPETRDIMVPLQDSPRPKSKSSRRRYTLMPIRTEAEMAHPDYDPIDCIGWQ